MFPLALRDLGTNGARLNLTQLDDTTVDDFRLMIDLVVVAGGKRLFPDDRALKSLALLDGQVTGAGAILATYAPAGAGSIGSKGHS